MPKRKRSSSLPSSTSNSNSTSPRVRLTRRNLDRLQQSLVQSKAIVTATAASMSRVSSPSRKKNNLDIRTKLEAYRITIDKDDVYPIELTQFIETIRRPRDPNVVMSPNAKKIVEMRRYVAAQNERTGINKVAPYILFVGEADFEDRGRPVPHITAKQEIGLNKAFLPPAPTNQIKETEGPLSSPQPDMCLGYVTRSDAQAAKKDAPFTAEEESTLRRFSLTQYMHVPFLTAQFKSPNSQENLHAAQNQSARDGAAIVNYLYDLHMAAFETAPTAAQACHFSLQSDLQNGYLAVHWREGVDHRMEFVHEFSLRNEASLKELRTLLHNILDHAVDDRLKYIKAALPKLAESQASKKFPMCVATDDSTAPSESSGTMPRSVLEGILTFEAPLTPSSGPSEPDKSRKRRKYT